MSYSPNLETPFSYDATNRLRVGQLTTLFDGKTLNADNALIWETVGTGLSAFQTNKMSLSAVSNGQYVVRKSKRYFPYYSGKSQQIEMTFDNFHTQSGITKRFGYFSSSPIAPYNTNLDGFFLEDDGSTKRLRGYRFGTETMNVPMSAWDNAKLVENYDWSNFTVAVFDKIWLGGGNFRFFLRVPSGIQLMHTYHYPGTSKDTFTQSPNHPVRYEIRSTGGSGEFRSICSQVSTEGSTTESGKQRSVNTGFTGVSITTAATAYPILGLRKSATFRDTVTKITDIGAFVSTASDQCMITLQLNPTLSAPLTWTAVDNDGTEFAKGTGAITVTTPGTILYSTFISTNAITPSNILDDDFLSVIGVDINNVSDQIIICANPISGTQTVHAGISFKEY